MGEPRNSPVGWIVVSMLAAMLLCLCLVVGAGGIALGTIWITERATDDGGSLVATEPGPTRTPVEFPAVPTAIPPQAEAMLELLASMEVPDADPLDIARRLLGIADAPRVVATSAEPIPVGSLKTFWASNVDTSEHFQVTAVLAYASEHVYFWIEQGVDYDPEDVMEVVEEFERNAYPTNRSFFGSEWTPGVDGDPHLYILFARGLGENIAGYFAPNDEYSPLVHEYSNAHEMFYLSADNLDLWDEYTDSVLAHEFQHMIQWHFDPNEESWMNEGFSELASHLNGYSAGGVEYAYLADPDIALTFWPSEPGTAGAHYGQAYLFVAYFLERFGADATRSLTAHSSNGLTSIDETLAELQLRDPNTGMILGADQVFRDWAVALLGDSGLSEPRYALDSVRLGTHPRFSDSISQCPLQPRTSQVSQYGLDYIRIRCAGSYDLVFEGSALTQVVPSDPYSGDYAFWSNKGDESDMTLTRAFDLRSASGDILLEYWLWYDLEEDYDYLYLEISLDAGQTWQIVTTPSGTSEDPSGNSYGWAYNGFSGGGREPIWIKEQVDLSQYAGQEIVLRFEYITDAAVNGDGLLLDDVAIAAIDYYEDFESGSGGWEGRGFVRLYNRIPQTYQLVLVEKGRQTRVLHVELDESRHARIPLRFEEGVDEFVLIVTGTARYTWQPAPYRLEIVP